MQIGDVYSMLNSITGFSGKVAYNAFPVGGAPQLPFICFLETRGNSFAADGQTYFNKREIDIELYAETRDLASEALIEAALSGAGVYFEREVNYLDDEKCFETIYTIEV